MKKFRATTDWNEDLGVYNITLHTDMGDCCGKAMMHEDDEKHKSEYFGGRLAEMRALVVYFKRRAEHERVEANALLKYLNSMRGTRTFKPWDFWVSQLEKEIGRKFLKAEEWKIKASDMKKHITEAIVARDAMFEAVDDAKLKPVK
jgi:hypothetical protein